MRSHKKAKTQSKPDAQWSQCTHEKKTHFMGNNKVGMINIDFASTYVQCNICAFDKKEMCLNLLL